VLQRGSGTSWPFMMADITTLLSDMVMVILSQITSVIETRCGKYVDLKSSGFLQCICTKYLTSFCRFMLNQSICWALVCFTGSEGHLMLSLPLVWDCTSCYQTLLFQRCCFPVDLGQPISRPSSTLWKRTFGVKWHGFVWVECSSCQSAEVNFKQWPSTTRVITH